MRTIARKLLTIVLLPVVACTTPAAVTADSAGCTNEIGELTVGQHKLWYEPEPVKRQKNKNCVDVSDGNSGLFWIRVKKDGDYTVDLADIDVSKKNTSDSVQFEVVDRQVIGQKKYVVVEVTVPASVPNNTDFGFNLEVDNVGVLDPTVRIIKANLMLLVSDDLKGYADMSFPPELAEQVKATLDRAFAPDAQSQ